MIDVTLEDVRVEREGRLVLDVPSLAFRGGRTTAILGPNGSGKTTLLRVAAGLEPPGTGRVRIGGSAQLARPGLAYVFQEQVFLRRSVRENLELGLTVRGVAEAQRRRRIDEAAGIVGVAHLLDRRADRLSGGEGRRVSLARALCLHAPLALLDEPLAGLDGPAYARLLDELPRIVAAFEATTLLVTHSRDEALRLADDLVVLVEGRVQASGETRTVASAPGTRAVAEALGYTVLPVGGRTIAVPPGAVHVGSGATEFSMTVDGVVDVADVREAVGRVEEVIVRARWTGAGRRPMPGDRIVVHASHVCPLE